MATRVSAKKFAAFLINRCLAKDGYIMGATGQDPKKWSTTSWWYTQYNKSEYTDAQRKKALYWRDHAKRVWDCNGLAEGYYKDMTGVDINTKARYNYANWCSVKGEGKVPNKHKVPGLAVFSGKSASTISHVGYLVRPINEANPEGDWYVIEARGVMYGVVETKLSARNWNWWGYMDKYYYYGDDEPNESPDTDTNLGYRTLRKGCEGEDVKELQTTLTKLGYELPKYGADGDFGSETETAVKALQTDHKLTVDGIVGKQTYSVLFNDKEDEPEIVKPTTKNIVVTGNSVNVRSTSSTSGNVLFTAHKNDKFEWLETAENGWHKISTNKGAGWISGKYTKIVEV